MAQAPLLFSPIAAADERRLLALAITYNDVADVVLDPAVLRSTDFYNDSHALIYTAMRAVRKEGESVNPVTVSAELQRRNKNDAAAFVFGLPAVLERDFSSDEVGAWIKQLVKRREIAEKQAAQQRAIEALEAGQVDQAKEVLDGLVTPKFTTYADEARRTLMHADALSSLPPTRWLVPGVIPTNKIVLGFGPPGIGKSFTFLDIGLTVAQFANVIYVAAEDAEDYDVRTEAWKEYHKLSAGGLYFWTEPLRLADLDAVDAFIGQISPLRPALIIIDPLADCMRGLNERDEEGMGAAVEALNRVRRATQACVLPVHHTGWSTEHERGSSLLRGAARVVIRVARDEDDLVTVSCEKINGGKRFDKRYFRHVEIAGSVVPVPANKVVNSSKLNERQIDVLEVLAMKINAKGMRNTDIEKQTNLAPSTISRMLNKFLELNLIYQTTKGSSTLNCITDSGRNVVLERAFERENEQPEDPQESLDRLNWQVDLDELSEDARSAHAPQGVAPSSFSAMEGYDFETNVPEMGSGREWKNSQNSALQCEGEVEEGWKNAFENNTPSSTSFHSSSALVPHSDAFIPPSSTLLPLSPEGSVFLPSTPPSLEGGGRNPEELENQSNQIEFIYEGIVEFGREIWRVYDDTCSEVYRCSSEQEALAWMQAQANGGK